MGFLICTSCARHVKAHDPSCPFCGALMRDANHAGNPGKIVRNRLALLFGSTAVAGAIVVACGQHSNSVPFYGCACPDDDDASQPNPLVAPFGEGGPITDEGGADAMSEASAADANPDVDASDGSSDDSGMSDAGD